MMMLKANVVKNCFLLTFYQKCFLLFQTVYLVKAKTFNRREGFAENPKLVASLVDLTTIKEGEIDEIDLQR